MKKGGTQSGAASQLTRIRQRKLVQWGLAYAAGAWVSLEVATLVGQQFGWPGWIGRVLIVLAVVGFPAALVLAWYHGERGRQRVSGPELVMLAALLLVAGAGIALVRRSSAPDEPSAPKAEDASLAGAGGASSSAADTTAHPLLPPDAPDPRRSLAVLPFTNLSPERESDYFADAVTEEILTALAKLQSLRVTSRTSVMRYKETTKSLPEIAGELGVAKVLEGSVRRQGDRVRIIAQLVDARTDTHLWSEAFERQVTDLFEVQAQIAQEIAGALETELSPAERERIGAGRTGELTAYDLYLRARELTQSQDRDPDAVRRAIQLLRPALEIDPGYARAYAGLAEALAVLQPFEGPRLGDTALAYAQRVWNWGRSFRRRIPRTVGFCTGTAGWTKRSPAVGGRWSSSPAWRRRWRTPVSSCWSRVGWMRRSPGWRARSSWTRAWRATAATSETPGGCWATPSGPTSGTRSGYGSPRTTPIPT